MFAERQLLSRDRILQGETILIENAAASSELKFSMNFTPKRDLSMGSTNKRDVFRPYGSAGSILLSELRSQLLNNTVVPMNVKVCSRPVELRLMATQNLLTRQPSRVIEVTFHRLIKLREAIDYVAADGGDQPTGYPSEPPAASEAKPNNIKMVLAEDPVVVRLNEVIRVEDIVPLEDEEQGAGSAALSKEEEIARGSINDTIKKQGKEEQKQNSLLKYNLFLDFDTCEPHQGAFLAEHRVDINKFGKAVDKEVNTFEINNTRADNKIKFKIFRDGSRQSERLR